MSKKLEVRVCVGSSCHIRGGTETLRALEALIQRSDLAGRVLLKADLCLEHCLQAPNVVVDGEVHGGVTPEKAEEFFNTSVLPLLGAGGGRNG